jgi:uncharacterized protein (TIRG00374 family)
MASPEPPVPEPNLKRRFLNWRTLVSLLIAIAIVIFAVWRAKIDPAAVWQYMRQANPWLYLVAFLSFYATFPLRAWRWRLLLENASAGDPEAPPLPRLPGLTEIIFLSWFANCAVPAKLGDLYRGYLLKQTSGASFMHTVGTIFAERVLDMLFLFVLMVASSLAVFGPRIPSGTTANLVYGVGIALVAVGVGVLLGMRFFGPALRRLVPARFQGLYDRFLEGTLLSFRWKSLPQLLVLTLVVWLLESLRFYLVLLSLPQHISLGLPVVVFIALASSLLTTLPLTPAGLGAVEAMFVWILPLFLPAVLVDTSLERALHVAAPFLARLPQALAPVGPAAVGAVSYATLPFFLPNPADLAAAVAMLDRGINFWSILFFGFIVFLLSNKAVGLIALLSRSRKKPAR